MAPRTGLTTTLAIAELDTSGAASYTFYLDGTAAAELHDGDVVITDDVDVLAVGTLGLVMHPIADTVDAAVAAVGESTLVARGRAAVRRGRSRTGRPRDPRLRLPRAA